MNAGTDTGSALPSALATLRRCLGELALVSDEIVSSTELRDGASVVDDLFERAAKLRGDLSLASEVAKGCALPGGRVGAQLVLDLRALNQRIRAGSAAMERILASRQTVERFGEHLVLQAMENLASTATWPSVVRLRDAFRGVPAVVVSAGPSLDRNIEVLRQFQGKALIIVVSHALRAVIRAGVRADVCVAVDAQDLRYHFADGAAEHVGALVLGTSVHPGLFALPARRFFTVAGNAGLDGWVHEGFEEEFVCRSGGSVANHAFSLATLWGCDPIVLAGQDLSFPGGKMYAATTCDGDARIEVAGDGRSGVMREASQDHGALGGGDRLLMREVPGYHGGTVPTSFAFEKAWEWFVGAARELGGTRTLVNSTEGGARIDGMEQIPLAEAARRYAGRDVDVNAVLDASIGQLDRPARRAKMVRRIDAMIVAVDRCASTARECVLLGDRAMTHPTALRSLSEREKELTRAVDAVSFVSTMVQREIRGALEAGKSARTLQEGLLASAQMYRAVLRVAESVRAPLRSARAALDANGRGG